jgi:hypothetical protein
MTALTDLKAIAVTATAKSVVAAKGADLGALINAAQRQITELEITLKQIIALHPNGGSVLAATVNASGSGGTNGLTTITGTTGTGTRFTARGNIVGGALTGPLAILAGGTYTVDPTTPAAEPVTGGGLTGATVALTLSGDTANFSALNAVLAELG